MTNAEADRIATMMRLGCCACAWIELPMIAEECHHILYGNVRLGHWHTLGLCRGHHQGAWNAEQLQIIEPKYRVSIADGRKAFTRVYPTERELWELTQARLRLPAVWPTTKLVPRKIA